MEFYIGQIIMFGGNFAIRSFALAQGQLMAISSNTALFSLYGTTYGGDGRTTFGLPDLRGRVPIQQGHGPGLPSYRLGERGGQNQTNLTISNMPAHNHIATQVAGNEVKIATSGDGGTLGTPNGNYLATNRSGTVYTDALTNPGLLNGVSGGGGGAITILNNGGNQPVNNMQPFLAINYEVCLYGIFPSRS